MKATSNQLPPFASRILRLFGIVVIVSSLIDYLVLLIPFNILERQWQISVTNQLVDRGIIPLVGFAFLFTGFWIDRVSGAVFEKPKVWQLARLFALGLSSLLGFIFLLLVPLHLNNTRLASSQALRQINQESAQAETQIDNRVATEIGRERSRIDSLLSDRQRLDTAIKSGQVPEEQATLLQRFQSEPGAIGSYLQQQSKALKPRLQTSIRARKLQLEQQTKTNAIKNAVRIGLSSLLLAIAYIFFGWTGLRETLL